jgi:hypothetical protein
MSSSFVGTVLLNQSLHSYIDNNLVLELMVKEFKALLTDWIEKESKQQHTYMMKRRSDISTTGKSTSTSAVRATSLALRLRRGVKAYIFLR